MKRITIVYRFLPQYRLEFYEKLKKSLLEHDIEMQLIYGKNKNSDLLRQDEVDIDWGKYIPNRSIRLGNVEILWQPCMKYLKNSDLIITEDANKLILNYLLIFNRKVSQTKLAFWGHGRNMQLEMNDFRNKIKSILLKRTDWYFAYTNGVKKYLIDKKYPKDRITVVQNAIDTRKIKNYYDRISENELKKKKQELGISGENVGIYCGAMYPGKRIDFLLETCYRIKKELPEFHMIFIGSGLDSALVKEASNKHSWIHYVGPKFGVDRVIYFKMAKIQLMPSAVGLGVLDSFALETALITTENPYHGPEIEYLENGKNGIITKDSLEDYANIIIDVLKNRRYYPLNISCRESYRKYTIEKMVENFTNGIISCLNIKKRYI